MRLATFDVYPKTLSEFRQRTLTGAAVSIACTLLIAVLTVIEVADYLQVRQDDHLFVDTSRGQQLRINLNVTFPALPCSVLSLDTLDVSGNHAANIMQNIHKVRLDARQHGRSVDSGSQQGAHAATYHGSRGPSACPCPASGPRGELPRPAPPHRRPQAARRCGLGHRRRLWPGLSPNPNPNPNPNQADGRRMPEDEPRAKAARQVAEAQKTVAQRVAEAAHAQAQGTGPTGRRLLGAPHQDEQPEEEADEEEEHRRRQRRAASGSAGQRRPASGIGELRAGRGADLRPAGGLAGGREMSLKARSLYPRPNPRLPRRAFTPSPTRAVVPPPATSATLARAPHHRQKTCPRHSRPRPPCPPLIM
jgi:hypothetical protein